MVVQYRKEVQQWHHKRQMEEMTSQPDAGFIELYQKRSDACKKMKLCYRTLQTGTDRQTM